MGRETFYGGEGTFYSKYLNSTETVHYGIMLFAFQFLQLLF